MSVCLGLSKRGKSADLWLTCKYPCYRIFGKCIIWNNISINALFIHVLTYSHAIDCQNCHVLQIAKIHFSFLLHRHDPCYVKFARLRRWHCCKRHDVTVRATSSCSMSPEGDTVAPKSYRQMEGVYGLTKCHYMGCIYIPLWDGFVGKHDIRWDLE